MLRDLLEKCKFGYPHKLRGYEFTTDDRDMLIAVCRVLGVYSKGSGFKKGRHQLLRNHPRLVGHVPEILQVWRGNIDGQVIKSLAQLLEYVLKYMLKPEVSSEAFSNVVRGFIDNFTEDSPVRKLFGRVLMKTLNEHDYSRTEAFRIFSPHDYVMYSRKFRSVNVLGTRLVDTTTATDDRRAVQDNLADKYWKREDSDDYKQLVDNYESGEVDYPRHPSDVSLYQFVSHFTDRWHLSAKLMVPHCTPNFYYAPKPSKKDYRLQYCRTMLLLHKPGTTPDTLSEDLEAELAEFVETDLCPVMLRGEYRASLEDDATEEPVNDHDELQPSPLDRPNAVVEQDDFMRALGGEVVQDTINADTDVDETTVQNEPDPDHQNLVTATDVDWEADRRLHNFTNQDIKSNIDWIERKRTEVTIPLVWDGVYSPDNLNEEQKEIFDDLQPLLTAFAEKRELPRKGDYEISGWAGTGKTVLIKTLMQAAENLTKNTKVVRVMAYTNAAADNFIGAQTIHKMLQIDVPRSGSMDCQSRWDIKELSGARLAALQMELRDCIVLIIDEKSFVGQWMLYAIDRRLRQAKPHHADVEFGNVTMILAGNAVMLSLMHCCKIIYEGFLMTSEQFFLLTRMPQKLVI